MAHMQYGQMEFESDEDSYDQQQYEDDMMGEYGDEGYSDQLDSSEEALQIRMHNEERIRQAQAKAAAAPKYQGFGSQPIPKMGQPYGKSAGASMMGGGMAPGGMSAGGMGAMGGMGQMGGAGGFSAGGMGGAGGMAFGSVGAAGGIGGGIGGGLGGAGGFQMGMAGGAGAFGAPQNDPLAAARPGAGSMFGGQKPGGIGAGGIGSGGMAFGSIGAAGGIGGGIGSGGMPGMGGASSGGDPYAYDVDLTQVKTAPKLAKPFEHKSEEEKVADAEARGDLKSNLKTTQADKANAEARGKKEVRFGKSTTYELNEDDSDDSGYNRKGPKGSPRPKATVVDEVDLDDGRDEKEKAAKAMQQEEDDQIAQILKQQAWMKEQAAAKEKEKNPSAKKPEPADVESSMLSSSYSQVGKSAQKEMEASYASDTFELDASMSGSNSKSSAGFQKKVGRLAAMGKMSNSAIEESETYEDEFESLSKSHQQMQALAEKAGIGGSGKKGSATKMSKLPSIKDKASVYSVGTESITAKYVKKENKMTMTELGKYDFMDAMDGGNFKEQAMRKNLEDAEIMIQDLKDQQAKDRDELNKVEERAIGKDQDYQQARREAMNAKGSLDREREGIDELRRKYDLQRREIEGLVRQIDQADAIARQKSDDIHLLKAEYERKLEQEVELVLYKRGKDEQREVYEVKREADMKLSEERNRVEKQNIDIDLFQDRIAKLEHENSELRLNKNKEVEKATVVQKKSVDQLKSSAKPTGASSKETELETTILQLEKVIDGCNMENEKKVDECKSLRIQVKQLNQEIEFEKKASREQKLKSMVGKDNVYVETEQNEVDMKTANLFGAQGAITKGDLQELHVQLNSARQEVLQVQADWATKEAYYKSVVNKEQMNKVQVEKRLSDTEFLVQSKQKEFDHFKDQQLQLQIANRDEIAQHVKTITFFRDNQRMLTDQDAQLAEQQTRLNDLQQQLIKGKEDRKRVTELEKQNALITETLKSRSPNNIPMMIQATKEVTNAESEGKSKEHLLFQIKQLETQLDEKDREHMNRVRGLMQDIEKTKNLKQKVNDRKVDAINLSSIPKGQYIPGQAGQASGRGSNAAPSAREMQLERENEDLMQENKKLVKQKSILGQKAFEKNAYDEQASRGYTPSEKKIGLFQEVPSSPEKSPQKYQQPFAIQNSSQSRSPTQVLSMLAGMKNLRSKIPSSEHYIKVNKLHALLEGQFSVDEIRAVKEFVEENADCVSDVPDTLDVDELFDAIRNQNMGEGLPTKQAQPSRPVQNQFYPSQNTSQGGDPALEGKYRRLQSEKDDDQNFYQGKIRRLERKITDISLQNQELEEECAKIAGQKKHLEKFFKKKLGLQNLREGEEPGEAGDINYMMRRLEHLEELADERNKVQKSEGAPQKREIERLMGELESEKQSRGKLMAKKNAEIAYFKTELDTLLAELASTQALQKNNKSIYN